MAGGSFFYAGSSDPTWIQIPFEAMHLAIDHEKGRPHADRGQVISIRSYQGCANGATR